MGAGNGEALTVPPRSSHPQAPGQPRPATHGSSRRHLRTVADTLESVMPQASDATSSLSDSPSQPSSHATRSHFTALPTTLSEATSECPPQAKHGVGVLSLKATPSFRTETLGAHTPKDRTQQRPCLQACSEAMQGSTESRPVLSNLAVPMPIRGQWRLTCPTHCQPRVALLFPGLSAPRSSRPTPRQWLLLSCLTKPGTHHILTHLALTTHKPTPTPTH